MFRRSGALVWALSLLVAIAISWQCANHFTAQISILEVEIVIVVKIVESWSVVGAKAVHVGVLWAHEERTTIGGRHGVCLTCRFGVDLMR